MRKMTNRQLVELIKKKNKEIRELKEDCDAEKASYIDLEKQVDKLAKNINESESNILTDGCDYIYSHEVTKLEIDVNKKYIYIYKGTSPLLMEFNNNLSMIDHLWLIFKKILSK